MSKAQFYEVGEKGRAHLPSPCRRRSSTELRRRRLVLELPAGRFVAREGRRLRSGCSGESDLDVRGEVVAVRRKERRRERVANEGKRQIRRDEIRRRFELSSPVHLLIVLDPDGIN